MTKVIEEHSCCATCVWLDVLGRKPECGICNIGPICDNCICICNNHRSDHYRHVLHAAHVAFNKHKRKGVIT